MPYNLLISGWRFLPVRTKRSVVTILRCYILGMKTMYVLFDDNDVLGVFDKTELNEEIEKYFGSFTSVKFTDVRDSGIEWIHEIRYDGMLGEESESTLTLKQYYLNEI
jgi:hypothetical protein